MKKKLRKKKEKLNGGMEAKEKGKETEERKRKNKRQATRTEESEGKRKETKRKRISFSLSTPMRPVSLFPGDHLLLSAPSSISFIKKVANSSKFTLT